jgi:acrylyl-CoA reductase (NADPH)
MTFRAVRADKTDIGQVVKLVDMNESELMDGDVTIRVTHSTANYKDGLALSGKSPVVRRFPVVLGVDLVGIVESSRRSDFGPGDEVILTGYGLSETHFGGCAEKARGLL